VGLLVWMLIVRLLAPRVPVGVGVMGMVRRLFVVSVVIDITGSTMKAMSVVAAEVSTAERKVAPETRETRNVLVNTIVGIRVLLERERERIFCSELSVVCS